MIDFSAHPWMHAALGDREMSAFFSPEADLERYLRIEAAWTRSLGDIEGQNADGIASQIEVVSISPEVLARGVERDGLPIPALVKVLKAQFAEEWQDFIHLGLTSQDVMDTSTVLALRDALKLVSQRLRTIEAQLDKLQAQFQGAALTAYTRMQPALKTTADVVIARWRQPLPTLLRDFGRYQTEIAQVQWGGPIGTRDHPRAKDLGARFAHHLGLRDPGQSWHTDRTLFVNAGQLMTRASVAMGKIGEDMVLMAAMGQDQFAFAGGGSSAMPHKNNPVAAEFAIAMSDHGINLNASLARSGRHEAFRSGRAWTLEWLVLPQMCVTVGAAMLQISRMLEATTQIGRA